MTILEIACHPLPDSFTSALAIHAKEGLEASGHRVVFHDLYAEGFDPVLPADELARGASFDDRVLAHQADLAAAGGLLVIHPDWWGQPPALLKGWLDRVLRPGVAWEFEGGDFEEKRRVPLLAGKTGLAVCTSDADDGDRLDALRALWVEGVMGWCGVRADCLLFAPVRRSDGARRIRWMRELDDRLAAVFPVP